jgi:hypothetical protein
MKTGTTVQYKYAGDHYGYTLVTSADGTVTNKVYSFNGKVLMQLSTNLLGELVIKSRTKMQLESYLKNVLDANGEEIYTDGVWRITQTAPLLGSMGIKDGYQYRAILIEGQI